MKYKTVAELPAQVRDVLPPEKQELWLAEWQRESSSEATDQEAYSKAWQTILSGIFGDDSPSEGAFLKLVEHPKLERCIMDAYNSDGLKKRFPDDKERKSHAIAICRSQLNLDERFGYVFPLADLQITEGQSGHARESWVQLLPLGDYMHPVYGMISVTPERVKHFAQNINAQVRGTMLDVDYEHKRNPNEGGRAAGWIVEAEDRDDGLWGLIRWTTRAADSIKNGEYKYISSELADKWTHPKTGQVYKDLVIGAGLTNRPFIKDILPINLSEYLDENDDYEENWDYDFEGATQLRDIPISERKKRPSSDFAGKGTSFPIFKPEDVSAASRSLGRAGSKNLSTDQIKSNIIRIAYRKGSAFVAKLPEAWKKKTAEEGEGMDFIKKLLESLKLSEGSTEEQVLEAINSFKEDKTIKLAEVLNVEPDKVDERIKTLQEYYDATKGKDEARQKFAEAYPEEAKRLELLERTNKESTVQKLMEGWSENRESKKGIPPVLHEDLKTFRLALDGEAANKFDSLMDKLVEEGTVDFNEIGGTTIDLSSGESKFLAEVEKTMKEHEISYKDAALKVVSERPELAEAWQDAAPTFNGRQGG